MKQDTEIARIWEEFKSCVTIDRFLPVEKIAYGLVTVILLSVIGAVMALVLRLK